MITKIVKLSYIFTLISSVFINIFAIKADILNNFNQRNSLMSENKKLKVNNKYKKPIANLNWEIEKDNNYDEKQIIWEKYQEKSILFEDTFEKKNHSLNNIIKLGSLGRSIVFDNLIIGPDISWIVPPGLPWNKRYKFDFLIRGHNTQIPEPKTRNFFGWNNGDGVALFSSQFMHFERSSFGINFGFRSIYKGDRAVGGNTDVGEGISSGFRWDYKLSNNSGLAFGAEQLIHFDNKTDTGRNFYLTASKAWWGGKDDFGSVNFPLYVATAGIGTGRMAVGTIRGLCSNSFGGSGTEISNTRNLCWAPVFSLAKVYNEKVSTYFEYNSRFFLLGSSIAPLRNIPIRGNLAVILSDHVDNYKLHNFSELNWVFNISLGF